MVDGPIQPAGLSWEEVDGSQRNGVNTAPQGASREADECLAAGLKLKLV